MTFAAQVVGALPGESTSVIWSANDQPFSNASTITVSPASGPAPLSFILKATSDLDRSKFASVPLVSLRSSDLTQIRLPDAVAYHPGTGFVYAASLVANGANVDTVIVQIAPDGTQSTVATFASEVITKLIPYSSGGKAYLLAVAFANGSINALDLSTKTFRRVVGGLTVSAGVSSGPTSAALHPVSGDLYIAEQNARRISVVTRAALDSAIAGTSSAPFAALPMTLPNVSGVGFLADPGTRKISLLASSSDGVLYRVNLASNTFAPLVSGLGLAEQILAVQSSQTGFSFVLTGSSNRIDGQGQVAALPFASGQPASAAYSLATGLDTVTDLAFVPPGTPYSSARRWLILAASSSPTAGRGKIVRWEPDGALQGDFYAYGDRVQPSLNLISPAPGEILSPGSAVELRWSYSDGNPLNPASAHFPAPVQILVSVDGGNSFTPTGSSYIPSGPQANQYSQIWQVPVTTAGQKIRIRVQTSGLDGTPLEATSNGEISVFDKAAGPPQALYLTPNFAVAGQNATIKVDGLNFQAATVLDFGDGVSISSLQRLSASQIELQLQIPPSTAPGPRTVAVCSGLACQNTEDAFFVVSPLHPEIKSVAPQSGSPGATVVITGANFSPVAADNVVVFGNLAATVSRSTSTQLSVQVPFGLNRGRLSLSVQTGGVRSNPATFFLAPSGFTLPFLNSGGVVNGASFSAGSSPVAPGSIVTVFGDSMAASIASATSLPLPTELLNATILIGGIQAPLFFAAPNQINAQAPEEIAGLSSVPVTIFSGGVAGNTVLLNVTPQNAGIFTLAGSGKGAGVVQNQNFSLNGPANPEKIGNTLIVYATGLGLTDPLVATGSAALSDPVSKSIPPVATIDGIQAAVTFAGRAPGFVGVDQVNVVIPTGVSTAKPVPLVLTAGGNASNTVTVNVAP